MPNYLSFVVDQLPILVGSFLGAAIQGMTLRQRDPHKHKRLQGLIQTFIGWFTAFFIVLVGEGLAPKGTDWKIVVGISFLIGNAGFRLAVWLSKGLNPLKLLPGANSLENEARDETEEKPRTVRRKTLRRK